MSARIYLVVLLVVCLGGNCWAKPKKHKDNGAGQTTILEVSPAGITVDTGLEAQAQFGITNSTKITLNGLPVTVDDLRAGMLVKVTADSTNQNAVTIDAKDAPKSVANPKVQHDPVVLNIGVVK